MPCPHDEACLSWLPDLFLWRMGCPDPPGGLAPRGCVAYGATIPDAMRVFRGKAGFAPAAYS